MTPTAAPTQTRMTGMYSTREVCQLTGVTLRQLDYWSGCGTIRAEHAEADGSGTRRRWSARQIPIIRVLARLATLGAQGRLMGHAAMFLDQIEGWDVWADNHLTVTADGTCDLTNTVLDVEAGFVIRLATCLTEPEPILSLVGTMTVPQA